MTDAHEPTPEDAGFIPGYILRNVGVPITLYRIEGGTRVSINGDEGSDFVTEKVHLRFDANAVAAMEDAFDGFRAVAPLVESTPLLHPETGQPVVGPAGAITIDKTTGFEERTYYGLEAFQKAMEVKPLRTIRAAMAAALRTSEEAMGVRMVDGLGTEYQNAVGVAWSIAQGVDPSDAARMFKVARDAVAAQRAKLGSELERTMDEASAAITDSPGNPGSEPGLPST